MRPFFYIPLVSLAVTLLTMPWIRKVAIQLGIIDQPNARKVHKTPIPLMGGLAIVLGSVLATLFLHNGHPPKAAMGALVAGVLVAFIGLLDDRKALSARVRLGVQLVAVGVLVYAGVRVDLPMIPDLGDYLITALWIVGLTNAINLMDNMDGLAAGVSAIAAFYIAVAGVINGQILVSGLASALFGACLGFLYFNFPPAKIFMGDSGAYFLGFWLSVLGLQLRFTAEASLSTWLVPVIVMGLPIFDTTLVTVSRIRRGIHPFTPGKDHVSHRLVRLGFDKRAAVLCLYLVASLLGSLGILLPQLTAWEPIVAVTLLAGIAVWAGYRLEQPPGLPAAETPTKLKAEKVNEAAPVNEKDSGSDTPATELPEEMRIAKEPV